MKSSKDAAVLHERILLKTSGCSAALITLNRPEKYNCFNTEVVSLLSEIFAKIVDEVQSLDAGGKSSSTLVAVIFTGNGKNFCVGADLTDPPDPVKQSSELQCCLTDNPVYQMSRVGIPIIGAIKGYCITGGFELALACDFLIGDPTTTFKDTHVKFGLAPCWGLSQKLQRLIGPGRAKYVSLSASAVSSQQALEWGLLNEVVPDVLKRSIEIANEIAINKAKMVRRYKRAIVEGGEMDLRNALKWERSLGMAHYVQMTKDNTLKKAKEYITNHDRPRSKM